MRCCLIPENLTIQNLRSEFVVHSLGKCDILILEIHVNIRRIVSSMSSNSSDNQNRSVSIDGSMNNGLIITGDYNTASIHIEETTLPKPESVNIQDEILALQALISEFKTEDKKKIERAFEDAKEELKKSEPNKDEVGQALERALNYAQKANGFAESIDRIRPHIQKASAWLGKNWYKFLSIVGLVV